MITSEIQEPREHDAGDVTARMSLEDAADQAAHPSMRPPMAAPGKPLPDALILNAVSFGASIGIASDVAPVFRAQIKDPDGAPAQALAELEVGEALAHYGICLPSGDGDAAPGARLTLAAVALIVGIARARANFNPDAVRAELNKVPAKEESHEPDDASSFGAW